jgi:hypothetical protein
LILLNFAHPLTTAQLEQLRSLTGRDIERILDLPARVDPQQPLAPQVIAIVDQCGLSATEWQTLPLLVNPPALNFVATVLLAELHGRCGYFPSHLRLRPVQGAIPVQYEVAEILNLQQVRDQARRNRD